MFYMHGVRWLLTDTIFQGQKVICPGPHSELVTKPVSWSVVVPCPQENLSGFRIPFPFLWMMSEGWLEMWQINL